MVKLKNFIYEIKSDENRKCALQVFLRNNYSFSSTAFDCKVIRFKSTVKEQNWSSNPTDLFYQQTKTWKPADARAHSTWKRGLLQNEALQIHDADQGQFYFRLFYMTHMIRAVTGGH